VNDKCYSDWGDVTAQIASSWKIAEGSWSDFGEPERLDYQLAQVVAALDDVIYHCGSKLLQVPCSKR
jgi:hypothetical protein